MTSLCGEQFVEKKNRQIREGCLHVTRIWRNNIKETNREKSKIIFRNENDGDTFSGSLL